MNLFFSSTDNGLILDTARRLLGTFQQMYPVAVEQAKAEMINSQSIEQAGRILVAAILATQDQLEQSASEQQNNLQSTIGSIKKQLIETEQNLLQVRSQNNSLQRMYDIQADELKDLRETITIQNRILVRQQQKLQNLLGNSTDDE